jgi:hypothetical protein
MPKVPKLKSSFDASSYTLIAVRSSIGAAVSRKANFTGFRVQIQID